MRINHNISALNTFRQLSANQTMGSKSLEKLSSGLRINRAGDDAAGLAISEKMRGQIRGLDQAASNAQDGISMIQTAEGALNETHSILQRMRELAVQASNDTTTDADRKELQKEMNQLTSEITRIGNNTEFNTKKVLNGSLGADAGATQQLVTFSIGTAFDEDEVNTMTFTIDGETYSIVGDAAVDTGTVPDVTGKTITIGTKSGDGTADDIVAGLKILQASDPTSKLAEFTVAVSGSGFTLTAKADGAYAGANADNNTIKFGSNGLGFGAVNTDTGAAATNKAQIQVGANNGQQFSVDIADMRSLANLKISGSASGGAHSVVSGAAFYTEALTDNSGGTEYALDITSASTATAAIEVIDNATARVSEERSKLGAFQNRLEHTINNLSTSSENLTAAESRVRDVDMAKEMMEFTKNNILSQAAQAMLAQANQQPQGVLQLLR